MSETRGGSENLNYQPKEESKIPCNNETGAIYFFKLDGRVFESEVPLVKPKDLLTLSGQNPQTHKLTRIFKNDCKDVLNDDEVIDLNNYGVEEFVTEKILVKIYYRSQEFSVHPGNFKVKDLKSVLGVPQAHHLAVQIHQELKPLGDDDTVCIQGGEHFVSYPCDGKAS